VAETIKLGPIEVILAEQEVIFRFADPMDVLLEVPGQLADELAELTRSRAAELTGKRLVMDLGGLRGLGSRHLGIMLAVRRVLEPLGQLRLTGVTEGARNILRTAGMDRLFELSE